MMLYVFILFFGFCFRGVRKDVETHRRELQSAIENSRRQVSHPPPIRMEDDVKDEAIELLGDPSLSLTLSLSLSLSVPLSLSLSLSLSLALFLSLSLFPYVSFFSFALSFSLPISLSLSCYLSLLYWPVVQPKYVRRSSLVSLLRRFFFVLVFLI